MSDRPLAPIVLSVHQTPARFAPNPMAIAVPALRRILVRLLGLGYRFVGLNQVGVSGLRAGTALLTADDGYASQAWHLAPLLRELGIPWTVFVLAGRLGMANAWDLPWISRRERHLTHDEVAGLARGGVTIGSHGMTHTNLTKLTDTALDEELGRSRNLLRDLTGQDVEALAFPWGAADARVDAAAERAGYRWTFGTAGNGPAFGRARRGLPKSSAWPRLTLYATDQILPLFEATALRGPSALRRVRRGAELLGRTLVLTAVEAPARRRA